MVSTNNKSEYLLAVIPPNPVKSEIELVKNNLKEHLTVYGDNIIPPYLKLTKPFYWNDNEEYLLVHHVKNIVNNCYSFQVDLNNFSSNKTNKLIVANVEDTQEIELCKDTIYNYFKELNCCDLSGELTCNLIIGNGDLKENHWHKAWDKIKDQKYNASFWVNNFVLFKNQKGGWVKKYQFDLD